MKQRFYTQFIFTITAATALATCTFFFFCKGLVWVKQDELGKMNYVIHDTTRYNCLFLGSSTTLVNINPALFDSLTGAYSFNAGMVMMQVSEMNMLVPKYVNAHGAPKQIFIDCDEATLSRNMGVWNFPKYYPMINDKAIEELAMLEPKLMWGKYLPAIACIYFGEELKNLALTTLFYESQKSDYNIPYRGFAGAKETPTKELPVIETYFKGSERGWQLLEETIKYCKLKNITVNLVVTPRYHYSLPKSSVHFLKRLKQFEVNYGVRFFDYSIDKRFQSRNLFLDRVHLTLSGADYFTEILARETIVQKNVED